MDTPLRHTEALRPSDLPPVALAAGELTLRQSPDAPPAPTPAPEPADREFTAPGFRGKRDTPGSGSADAAALAARAAARAAGSDTSEPSKAPEAGSGSDKPPKEPGDRPVPSPDPEGDDEGNFDANADARGDDADVLHELGRVAGRVARGEIPDSDGWDPDIAAELDAIPDETVPGSAVEMARAGGLLPTNTDESDTPTAAPDTAGHTESAPIPDPLQAGELLRYGANTGWERLHPVTMRADVARAELHDTSRPVHREDDRNMRVEENGVGVATDSHQFHGHTGPGRIVALYNPGNRTGAMVHLDMTAVGDTSGEEMITDVIANVPELRQPGTTARIIGDNYNPVAAAVMDPALGSQEEWSGRLNARLGTHGIAAEIITEPADAITAGKDVFLDTHAGTITVYGGNRRQLLHEVITTPESPKRAGQLAPTERPAAEASDDVPRLSMRAVAGTVVSGNTDRLRDQAAQALSVYEAHVAATVARGGEIDHMHFWDSVLPRGENGLNVLSQLIIDAQPALTEVGEQGVQQLVVGRLGSALRDLGQRLARIPEASTSRRSVREAILARQALLRQIHDRIINEQRTTD